ncbi:MAG: inositol monophosphatase family protein [Gemmatimonadetes bacterium]|nr:inositol monophosphatase family protein [Gemmatimonadota bacterium]NNM03644.1 inositol monophosphatase family protein [Gemmatimonadota bacterium]
MEAGTRELADLLQNALQWAREAGAVTLRHFGTALDSETKGDGTPVTVADRAAETLLRERIGAEYPHHGILGEEFGETNPGASVRWIVDPIDGTRSFVRGVPIYGVLIGIDVEGVPMVGVAHFPALRETVGAALGHGCDWNGRPARVSRIRNLPDAAALTTDPAELLKSPVAPGWEELVEGCSLARTWGDCYGHVLVATGRAEIMIDPVLSPWDAAPFVPILEEAGGRFTDLAGNARLDGGSGISTNGLLHDRVLALLQAR